MGLSELEQETTERLEDDYAIGEVPDLDIRSAFARHSNRLLRSIGKNSSNIVIDLGTQHGEVRADHVRFRDAKKEGHLMAYIRQEALSPKLLSRL